MNQQNSSSSKSNGFHAPLSKKFTRVLQHATASKTEKFHTACNYYYLLLWGGAGGVTYSVSGTNSLFSLMHCVKSMFLTIVEFGGSVKRTWVIGRAFFICGRRDDTEPPPGLVFIYRAAFPVSMSTGARKHICLGL